MHEGHHGGRGGEDADGDGVEGEAGHGGGSCPGSGDADAYVTFPDIVPHASRHSDGALGRPRTGRPQTSVMRSPACAL
ncbi:hypothetical protein GCM10010357_65310 [Streptomyces luteireticuli]|uniref:Uncharacterized protein n=1 Tax=Streptomyces luteireticuli TaxID=173858 RepID=A0ABN0Z627_9ACTN